MNGDLVPAVVAASGGTALIGTAVAYEFGRDRDMRRSRQALRMTFPVGAQAADGLAALRSLAGFDYRSEYIAEVAAGAHGVEHLLHVPEAELSSVRGVFEAAVPGLRIEPVAVGSPWEGVTFAVRFFTPKTALLTTDDPEAAARTLLGGLTALADNERVALRWALRPGGQAPDATPTTPSTLQQATAQRITRLRQSQPGFAVAGLLLVQAPTRAGQWNWRVTSRRRCGRVGALVRACSSAQRASWTRA